MARIRKAANGYEYFSYESEYLCGDWDIIPESYGVVKQQNSLRVITNDKEIVKKIHPETLKKRRKAVLYGVMIAIVFAMMVAVVYRYASLSEMHINNVKQQEKIDGLTEQVNSLEVSMNTNRHLNSVMQRANEMGMDFASSENVKYIELNYEPVEYDNNK